MRTVRHLLESKTPEVYAIGPDQPVLEAIKLMADNPSGALRVLQGGRRVGIVSARDYARKRVLQGRASSDTPVRDIMSSDVVRVGLSDTTAHCMQLVTDKRIRHLPVVDGEAVLGVISIGDLVKAVIEDQQVEIDQLQRYIAS